ncbi:hypothetical protein CASFOL_023830 [Castilleja foliolosa]|uniref:Uncharacterized protein n=1 Tax=Castilleja foliolosa TaxID=1961234 RepID=A0ABD3CLN0_9LAMI
MEELDGRTVVGTGLRVVRARFRLLSERFSGPQRRDSAGGFSPTAPGECKARKNDDYGALWLESVLLLLDDGGSGFCRWGVGLRERIHGEIRFGFVRMSSAVDALSQLMGIYFFGKIEDQYIFFKVFLMMKFMPFANLAPWVKGLEWESSRFIVIWFFSDLLVGLVFAIDSWVVIVDSRRGGREIVKEGYRLLVALFWPAFEIRWLEVLICGSLGRWMLKRVFGEVLTIIFQSLMEVYFMVAWLVFYFAARQKGRC